MPDFSWGAVRRSNVKYISHCWDCFTNYIVQSYRIKNDDKTWSYNLLDF